MTAVATPVAAPAGPSPASVRRRAAHRRLRVLVLLGLAVVVMLGVDVLLGRYTVTIADFVRILAGHRIPGASFIVLDDKLPRAVVGALVGVGFGVSGAIFQTLLRNPLASPDVVGVTSGASAAAVFALVVLGGSGVSVPLAALVGAALTAVAMQLLAARSGVAGQRLVLVGIGLAAVLNAVTSYLLTSADLRTAADALVWLTGSLNHASWPRAGWAGVAAVVLLPFTAALTRGLRGLELGDDVAAATGLPVRRVRFGLLALAVALAAVATAAAGPISFVAFLAGPIARRLLGGATSLAAAGLVGALVVLGGDFVAANLLADTPLPVGVVTGALGAPFLLYLLAAANRGGRGG
ncbi:FecCD family ABC transporter permease [uncultured Friedmanniella sp.]|uniref:FecCD family ABC transporter permease n=1 Tax=uncultured Friedmanniella sp. TaxID=335381 RepID=UPI0035CB7AEF